MLLLSRKWVKNDHLINSRYIRIDVIGRKLILINLGTKRVEITLIFAWSLRHGVLFRKSKDKKTLIALILFSINLLAFYRVLSLFSDWLRYSPCSLSISTIVAIWRENMLGYLSADNICSEKRTVFRERIVIIILQIFFATRAVLKIGEYSRIFPSFSWGIFGHVTRLGQSRVSKNIWWIIIGDR